MAKTLTVTAWIREDDTQVEDMAEALRKIADQLDEGYTSGNYPTWELKVDEEE